MLQNRERLLEPSYNFNALPEVATRRFLTINQGTRLPSLIRKGWFLNSEKERDYVRLHSRC
jgi:hypothetical protein